MASPTILIFLSVILVSLISFIGVFALSMNQRKLNKFLLYFVSFAAGALLGDAFIHLLPESTEEFGFNLNISIFILLGILIFFILEKFIHWEHCHGHLSNQKHVHPYAFTSLIGDALHNFIDGVIIAAAYLASVPIGITTTIAVILHEIPQEIGDFSILVHGGFSSGKALLLNFGSALVAVVGAVLTMFLNGTIDNIELFLIPVSAGGFIYIAASDLIPELHKETNVKKSFLQLISLILGILIMSALLYFG